MSLGNQYICDMQDEYEYIFKYSLINQCLGKL